MKSRDAHLSWEELAAFDSGRLRDDAWTAVADHLSDCGQCGSLLDTIPQDRFVRILRTPDPRAEVPSAASAGGADLPEALMTHPRYRVLERVGAGGMGTVFKAEHILMGRVVALKVLKRSVMNRPAAREHFCREVKALARLAHPNLVAAFDAEAVDDLLFLVMEFVEGESLDRILGRSGQLPIDLAGNWIRQAAHGLQFAWEQGLVHRDLKPANIMVTPGGQVKILDFGLTRLLGETASEPTPPHGCIVGTPAYAAPEQMRDAETADIRADLYSLGCTWYEMLAGRPPFPDARLLEQLLAHQDQTPAALTQFRADVPPRTVALVQRLLAKDPAARFQTPQELLSDLTPSGSAPTSGRRRRLPAMAIAAAVAVAGLALCLLWATGWFHADRSGEELPGKDDGKVMAPPARKPHGSARELTVSWLRDNAAAGLGQQLADDNDRLLEARLIKGKAFVLRLGPSLVRSGQPTLLAGRQSDFFAFQLPEQARAPAANTSALAVTAEQSHEFHADPPVLLADLRIDEKRNLSGDREVTGSVAYRATKSVSGKLALRLTFMLGTSTRTHYELLDDTKLTGEGATAFSFSSLYGDDNRWTGATVLFVDLCSLNDPSSRAKALVLSNTVADLVLVQNLK